jgi:hypothetical protein
MSSYPQRLRRFPRRRRSLIMGAITPSGDHRRPTTPERGRPTLPEPTEFDAPIEPLG